MVLARALRGFAGVALGGLFVTAGLLIINTKYAAYDDEGYMLLSLRHYLSGLPLYAEVFSQYGPWPFVYHQLVTLGGNVALTHQLGQYLTAFHWAAAALVCGVMVWRLSDRMAAGIVAATGVFCLTWQTSIEPSHPGSHVMLLVALAAGLAAELETAPWRRPVAAAGLGVVIALVVLTKINVGGFLAIALGTAWVRFHWTGNERTRGPVDAAGAAFTLILPWLLVGAKASEFWVFALCLLTTLANAGLFWIRPPAWERPAAVGALPGLMIGGIITTVVVCLVVVIHGTTLAQLARALFIQPLSLPANFMLATHWPPSVWALAAVCGLVVGRAGWELRRQPAIGPFTRRSILILRGMALAGAVLSVPVWASLDSIVVFTNCCLPLLPVFVIPLDAAAAAANRPRWIVASMAALQMLHLYPVAGSQRGWSIFLCVPILVLGWDEALKFLAPVAPRRVNVWRAFPIGFAVLSLVPVLQLAGIGWRRHQASRPLDLPGTESRRLPEPQRLALRVLTLNASLHADLLFSTPGMGSFNLWSGAPPPTAQHVTQWFWLLPAGEQRRIRDRLAATPRSAVIVCQASLDFLQLHQVDTRSELHGWLARNYRELFSLESYTFMVPNGSRAVPFGMVRTPREGDEAAHGSASVFLETCLALDGKFGRVDLERRHEGATVSAPARQPTLVDAERITTTGQATGARVRLTAGQALTGLYRLSIRMQSLAPPPGAGQLVLVVRDPTGAVLAEALFL